MSAIAQRMQTYKKKPITMEELKDKNPQQQKEYLEKLLT